MEDCKFRGILVSNPIAFKSREPVNTNKSHLKSLKSFVVCKAKYNRFMRSILLFILLCQFNSYSQMVRTIVDNQTKLPIPYVTVKVLNSNKGIVAFEDGSFQLEISNSDTVMFSCVGYEQRVLAGKEIENVISLIPKIKVLDDVTVSKLNFRRTVFLGNKSEIEKANISWGPSGSKEEFAQKIELPDSNLWYQVKKIYVPVKKVQCWDVVLLYLYLADKNDYPGEEIFLKPILVGSSNINKNRLLIDLSNERVYLSHSKIFFISIGWPNADSKQKCKTAILLNKSTQVNTYSRSLVSKAYYWHSILFGSNPPLPLNTLYSVEVDELQ